MLKGLLIRWLIWVSAVLILPQVVQATETLPNPSPSEQSDYHYRGHRLRLNLFLSTGIRLDQLRWNTAASSNHPNILSELEWRGVKSHQLTTGGYLLLDRLFYGRGHVNYAWIQSGTVRDSDYGEDDYRQEWSCSISETHGDQLWDVVAGGGYPLFFLKKRLLVAPMLGASIHKQNLRITNGQQVVSQTPPDGYDAPPPVGPLNGLLNSMYSARWLSVWTGFDLRYHPASPPDTAPPMEWGLSLAYHFWADYLAEADWNLRGDLQHPLSFKHETDAQGLSLQAQWLLRLNRHWNLQLNLDYYRWEADPGMATIYPASAGAIQTTRLNEVSWESRSVTVGATFRFF